MTPPPEISLVVPAYDEVGRIRATVARLSALLQESTRSWEIIVVADGGPEALAREAEAAARDVAHLQVLVNAQNRGKGYSVRRGILASSGRITGFLDADLAQPAEALPAFFARIRSGADVAIGLRESGPTASHIRRATSTAFSRIARAILGLPFRDIQCGMKIFEGDAGRALFRAQRLDRFAFDAEVLAIAVRWGLQVVEVPVTVQPQVTSTVRVVRDGSHMLADLARIRWHVSRGEYDACSLPGAQRGRTGAER